jgi:uncharacterized protein (TIGR00369 family)
MSKFGFNEVGRLSHEERPDLKAGIEAMPACQLIGAKVLGFEVATGPAGPGSVQGRSGLECPVRPSLTFDGRVVQAGVVGMLADFAGVSAAACTLPAGWMCSTTSFEVHNLAPAVGERLVALGQSLQVGKSHAVSRAEVYAVARVDGEERWTLVCAATTTSRPFQLKV